MTGKVELVAVVGNEDGAHKVIADLIWMRRPMQSPMPPPRPRGTQRTWLNC